MEGCTIVDEEHIIGFDALYESMLKCRKGVMWKDSVAYFTLNALEEVLKLEDELKAATYEPKPAFHFTVKAPKEREIVSVAFRDRVYQRSLNDNAIYPQMSSGFIRHNCACQKDKGTDFARDELDKFLHEYYRKHSNVGYVAQFDIHGYYPNMRHDVAEFTFQRRLEANVYKRAVDVLRKQYHGDVGYNPGSQMVQIAGISVLDVLDHYIKEQLHIKYYIRYMDDFILIHEDKEYLQFCKDSITEILHALYFEPNDKKTKIYPLTDGIMFLGFRFKLTDTGKVLRFINPNNVKNERKKLYRMVKACLRGEITKEAVYTSYQDWREHASKGTSYKLLKRMDAYYKNLWIELGRAVYEHY